MSIRDSNVEHRKSVVVTGASSGIGRACVQHLVSRGFHVWAGVRTEESAADLRRSHARLVDVLCFDVTDDSAVTEAGRTVCAAGPIHGLVNNAGSALPGPLELMSAATFRQQLDVNLVSQLTVTKAMIPGLKQASDTGARTRVVNIGSIGGRVAGAMMGSYHASKFGLVGLTDALRLELAHWGIGVVLIEPGSVATPIWQKGVEAGDELVRNLPVDERHYARQMKVLRSNAMRTADRGVSPESVAIAILKALTVRNPRPRQAIGRDAALAALALRVLPHQVLYRLVAATEAVL
ncbi:SDR family NAD(P)-dependent oxidoreductase [Amycolatopsis sp. NPDC049868]|uniref:SDR family NAD(P)-dependent oxidoreductase n=1 Tax=Amycolatopsis sp. NPDC049868 TaxID=3363934 RepID=UPI0037A91BCE